MFGDIKRHLERWHLSGSVAEERRGGRILPVKPFNPQFWQKLPGGVGTLESVLRGCDGQTEPLLLLRPLDGVNPGITADGSHAFSQAQEDGVFYFQP